MNLPQRKHLRLQAYDYSTPGYYFITICTMEKRKLLCEITEGDVLTPPVIRFTGCGDAIRRRLEEMAYFYKDIHVEKYVIMPNHVHLLMHVLESGGAAGKIQGARDSKISRFISTFKRLTNRELGSNIWQYRSYDHVIRGEQDYLKIWEYIDNNPAKWAEDRFYAE